jgi:hypothetical protein
VTSWSDVYEDIMDVVVFVRAGRETPYDLAELEDHLFDYAHTTDLETLSGFDRYNLLLNQAEMFDGMKWQELMERTTEYDVRAE